MRSLTKLFKNNYLYIGIALAFLSSVDDFISEETMMRKKEVMS